MSRVSNTRLSPREAAALLVAADRREHAERAGAAAAEQARFQTQLEAHATRIVELEHQLAAQAAAAEPAHARIAALEKQLADARERGETKLDALRATHEQEVGALHASAAMRNQSFQTELDKAVQRMEGDQNRMTKQISEARADQKRAEALLLKMQQTSESSQTEMSALRAELADKTCVIEQHKETTAKKEAELIKLQAERENLLSELAAARSKLEASEALVASLEPCAAAAGSPSTQVKAKRISGAGRGKARRTSKIE
ncbi:Chromosome partition protein Smc [Caballeronia choica]|uniref:Chromosome partition protein Smc n=1 Tax=Caballeronia choica TaxID=326476 RepID=A0A158ITJ0_9BURK|nr:hypothetical protein [Caballeronia choica]SAL59603.1 Chromosome partition protein Smc [Caballeronia choica]